MELRSERTRTGQEIALTSIKSTDPIAATGKRHLSLNSLASFVLVDNTSQILGRQRVPAQRRSLFRTEYSIPRKDGGRWKGARHLAQSPPGEVP